MPFFIRKKFLKILQKRFLLKPKDSVPLLPKAAESLKILLSIEFSGSLKQHTEEKKTIII